VNAHHARIGHLVGCAWFWVWALVGFGLALGAVSLGGLVVFPLVLVALSMASSETIRHSAFGLLTGAGGLCLLVAWLQRGGENLDARPWLALGLVLALVGLVGHAGRGD
jgi:hypothetical protein